MLTVCRAMWRGSLTINAIFQAQSLLEVKVCIYRRAVIIDGMCDIRGVAVLVNNIHTRRFLLGM